MEIALFYLLSVFIAGILAAVFAQRARPLTLVIIAILSYMPSYFIWFLLQYLSIVSVDALLKQYLGLDTHQLVGTPLGAFILFGPPLLPPIVMLGCVFLLRQRRSPA